MHRGVLAVVGRAAVTVVGAVTNTERADRGEFD
jgi:hypothetical protein